MADIIAALYEHNPALANTDGASSHPYDPAFAEDDANIILQSSDGIRYRVYPFTLRTTSGFFRTMLTLPQSDQSSRPCRGQGQDCGVIVLDETSKVLGTLLRMIGGLEFPKWKSNDELENIWIAAEKYDMPGPLAIIRAAIATSILKEPLKLYSLAARFGWEDEAKIASKHSLGLSILEEEFAAILEQVPTAYVLRLFRLRQKRRDDFREHIQKDTFGIGSNCGICRQNVRYEAFSSLIKSMVLSMDQRPDGQELLDGEWKKWPAMKEPACNRGPYCGLTVSQYESAIATRIASSLKSLPCTI